MIEAEKPLNYDSLPLSKIIPLGNKFGELACKTQMRSLGSLIPGTKELKGLEKAQAVEPGRRGFQTVPTIYQLWGLSK